MEDEIKRKLAKIVNIDSVNVHSNADSLELAMIGGWQVVIRKGEFKAGDVAVYFEVDSWVPTELAPFLSKGKEPREYCGVKGEKLRTIRLRGELSQGLLLPITIKQELSLLEPGSDVTELLGVLKYEPPIPACLAGVQKGNFPATIRKTDCERIQNLNRSLEQWIESEMTWEVSEKIDGTSVTFALIDGEFIVCSRNINLVEDKQNLYWKTAREYEIEQRMRAYNLDGYALQGEIYGNSVQGNKYNLNQTYLALFTVQSNGNFLTPIERQDLLTKMALPQAPIFNYVSFKFKPGDTIKKILEAADGKSVLGTTGTLREGLVFKSTDGKEIVKAVSNAWLEKFKD